MRLKRAENVTSTRHATWVYILAIYVGVIVLILRFDGIYTRSMYMSVLYSANRRTEHVLMALAREKNSKWSRRMLTLLLAGKLWTDTTIIPWWKIPWEWSQLNHPHKSDGYRATKEHYWECHIPVCCPEFPMKCHVKATPFVATQCLIHEHEEPIKQW